MDDLEELVDNFGDVVEETIYEDEKKMKFIYKFILYTGAGYSIYYVYYKMGFYDLYLKIDKLVEELELEKLIDKYNNWINNN
jgi:hypothetical protein